MKTVIIVSKCSRIIKLNSSEDWLEFHFKGVCAGEVLRRVRLRGRKDFNIRVGEEYLIYAHSDFCQEGTLVGQVIKVKLLSECWDRS